MSIRELSPEELVQFETIMKDFGPKTTFNRPVLKRYIIGDGKGGFEFRPFGKFNYGYPMQEWMLLSWPLWVLEIVFSFSEGWKRGLAINAFALGLQEIAMPAVAPNLTGGASFVHNLLAGYNIVRNWKAKSGMRLWAKRAGFADVVVDAGLIPYEELRLDAEFGTMIGHKFHAIGLAIGGLAALI